MQTVRRSFVFLAFFFFNIVFTQPVGAQPGYPANIKPGAATLALTASSMRIGNQILQLDFSRKKGALAPLKFFDIASGVQLDLSAVDWFSLTMSDGSTLHADNFTPISQPVIAAAPIDAHKAQESLHIPGKSASMLWENKKYGIQIRWQLVLRNGSNYIRQIWHIEQKNQASAKTPFPFISRYNLLQIKAPGIHTAGTVDGTPLVTAGMFFALEHPMSKDTIEETTGICYLPRQNTASREITLSTVMGVSPAGQLRRAFLYYHERERAHPSRPFLHYNSWYDLSWIDRKLRETDCLDRIKTFGDSLVVKRNVAMKAFLFDDGWDNDASLWQVSDSFPHGFSALQRAATAYHAHLGIWVSPWGGYDPQQAKRLKFGKQQYPPFETNDHGFSLAGPVYYQRFKEVTTRFMQRDDVAIFKFDGVGAGNGASGAGLDYQNDIDAFLKLTKDLREVHPDIYLSLTVGTWPSVYWLNYGDAVWRAGGDFGKAGVGPKRQQWITYRDGQSYKNVVCRAPLYPLNSLMLHGICISKVGYPAELEMDEQNVADGIWSFFATGTTLQELYVNPHLLTTPMWNTLAKAAGWAQQNAAVLEDTHWIGGDPQQLKVYGYASWTPEKAIISLRNPSDKPQTFRFNLKTLLELPGDAGRAIQKYRLHTVIDNAIAAGGKQEMTGVLDSQRKIAIRLAPFELMIEELYPVRE